MTADPGMADPPMPGSTVTAFAPATVGNVICGFDTFGLAMETPGDRVTVRVADQPGVRIVRIDGDEGKLPTEAEKNSASVAIQALLQATGSREGIEVYLEKGLPLSGGMGGSAASSVAAAVAADALLGTRSSSETLLECALAGEGMASGGAHLDNVAPALLGGFLLVRPSRVRPIVRLPIPHGLSIALLHPSVEMSTKEGRAALGNSVALSDAVIQWGNTSAFVQGLHSGDWELVADALEDRIAEPHRAHHIPGFHAVRRAALKAGAVGCGISGAGPSIMALCRTPGIAGRVGEAMQEAFRRNADVECHLFLSPVSSRGARVVPSPSGGF
jgi:homoserine kinase